MIRNIVLFRLDEGLTRESSEVIKGIELIEQLPREIPEILEWEIGWHALPSTPVSHDFVLTSLFADSEAFFRYFHHPAHRTTIAHWKKHASWAVIDVEV
ncbi:Dabb family protein [Streptomyces sp. NPDC086091]|uniref:Dabb family protein n=1 Tax=Streptomyces sp. NPDC086091 TaxID=3365751 RepID=UPI00382CCE4F